MNEAAASTFHLGASPGTGAAVFLKRQGDRFRLCHHAKAGPTEVVLTAEQCRQIGKLAGGA